MNNKKVIALSVFFILGIACFSIISLDNKIELDNINCESIETYDENFIGPLPECAIHVISSENPNYKYLKLNLELEN